MPKGFRGSLMIFSATLLLAFTNAAVVHADPAPAEAPKPAAAPAPAPKPTTTADPTVPVEDLKLMIEPMTKPELEVEANGWFSLLQAKVREISDAELAVRHKNREIAALKDVKKAANAASKVATGAGEPATDAEKEAAAKLAEANAKLAETVEAPKPEEPKKDAKAAPAKAATAKGAAQPPQAPTGADILKKAAESAQKSGDQAAVEKVAAAKKEADAAKEVAAIAAPTPAPATKAAKDAAPAPAAPVAPDAEQAKEIAAKTDEAAAAKADVKVQLVDYSTKLAAERTGLIDRLKVVLDEIDLLGGDTKGMRAYIAAVSGLKVEVSDFDSTVARLKAWLTADEGGLRWARNIALFFAYLVGAWILSKIVRGALARSIGMASSTSKLLRNFIIDTSGRAVMAVGFLAGLSALEIDLAPLLAVIGAAGFVVAFALQGTLSNFASGLLIMVNKPFDIGDDVEVGGDVKGHVEDVSIFSTSIRTEDGMKKIVPNNSIWNNVIVNKSTGTTTASHGDAKTA